MVMLKFVKGERMKKSMSSLILIFLLCISIVSAITIYAGESIELQLEKPYEYYSVVGNSTEVILEIIQDGNNVTIIPDKYSQEDSYEIIFFDREKEVITISSGGGGSRTIYEDRNITKYIYRNVTKYIEREEVDISEEIVNDKEINPSWIRLGIDMLLCLIIFILFVILSKKFRKGKEEDLKGGKRKNE